MELDRNVCINVWLYEKFADDDFKNKDAANPNPATSNFKNYVKYKMQLSPADNQKTNWQLSLIKYSKGFESLNEKVQKLRVLLSLMSKHFHDYHFFFLTGYCIQSFDEKIEFITGIIRGHFRVTKPHAPKPCPCISKYKETPSGDTLIKEIKNLISKKNDFH